MAAPCIITYKGKDYSYAEFMQFMHDGHLDELIKNKIIDDTNFIKPKVNAIPVEKTNEVDVRQQARDGETLGKGNSQSKIIAGQEKIVPEEEINQEEKQKVIDKIVKDAIESENIEAGGKQEELLRQSLSKRYDNKKELDRAVGITFKVEEGDVDEVFLEKHNISPNKYVYKTSKDEYTVDKIGDKLVIVNKKGEEPSENTRLNVIKDYEKNFDYTKGKSAFEGLNEGDIKEEEADRLVADKSENPNEIIEAHERLMNDDPIVKGSPTEFLIAENIGKIKQKGKGGYNNFGDSNNVTQGKALAYFNESKGEEIDTLAQRLSDEAGYEITPQDIVGFVDKYPNGISDYTKSLKNPLITKLADRFRKITGLTLNNRVIEASLTPKEKEFINQEYKDYEEYRKEYFDALESGAIELPKESYEETEIVLPNTIEGGSKSQTKEVAKDIAEEPPINKPPSEKEEGNKDGKGVKHKIGERAVESNKLDEDVKEGLKKRGIAYLRKPVSLTKAEANEIINEYEDAGEIDKLVSEALNTENGIKPDVRTALMTSLVKYYINESKAKNISEQESQEYKGRAIDLIYAGQKFATELGRAVNAQKVWQDVLGKNPEMAAIAVQKEIDKQNNLDQTQIDEAKKSFDELINSIEFQEAVTKEISKKQERLFGKETQDKIKNFFDSAKIDTQGKAFDATIGLPVAIYNGAVEAMKQAALLGAKGAQVIAEGVQHIRDNYSEPWNEEEFKKQWKKKLKDSGIKFDRELIYKAEKLKQKSADLDALIKNPKKVLENLEKKKTEVKPEKTDEVKSIEQEIKEKKKIIKFLEKLEGLTNSQKMEVLAKSSDFIIKNGYLTDSNFKDIFAKAIGKKTLSEADIKNINELSSIISDVNNASEAYLENPNKETAQAYKNALYKGQLANSKLSKYFQENHTWGGLIKSFIQGNLLSIRSIVQNPAYNILNAPVNFVINAGATAGDWLLYQSAKLATLAGLEKTQNKILKKFIPEQKRTISIVDAQKGYYKGWLEGLKTGVKQFKTGAFNEDVNAREMQKALHPMEALTTFWSGLSGKEKIAFGDQVKNVAEGVLGIAPETMFRLLNLGDKPFRLGAEKARLAEIVTEKINQQKRELKNKKELTEDDKRLLDEIESGREYDRQFLMPDEATEELIKQAGLEATYQQTNLIAAGIKRFLTGKKDDSYTGKVLKNIGTVVAATQAPYIQTPLNVLGHMFYLTVPSASIARGVVYAVNGDRRNALKMFSTAIVGMIIAQMAKSLIQAGVISGGDDDDDKKERGFKYQYERPRTFNWDLYQRILRGEGNDGGRESDYRFDYSKSGLVGAIMYSHAKLQDDPDYNKDMSFAEEQMKLMPVMAKTAFEQSFLANTNKMLEAFNQGGYHLDSWLSGTANALKAIVVPNTTTSFSNMKNEFLRDTRDKDVLQWIKNNWKDQLFQSDGLPKKVNIWGEPIKKTPDDRNNFIYWMFDFTKGAKNDNPFGWEIYKLWKDTKSTDVMPPAVPKKINGEELNGKQYEELSVYVGQARKNLASWYLQSEDWKEDSEEKKIEKLKQIYSVGMKEGKAHYEFINKIKAEKIVNEGELKDYERRDIKKQAKKMAWKKF